MVMLNDPRPPRRPTDEGPPVSRPLLSAEEEDVRPRPVSEFHPFAFCARCLSHRSIWQQLRPNVQPMGALQSPGPFSGGRRRPLLHADGWCSRPHARITGRCGGKRRIRLMRAVSRGRVNCWHVTDAVSLTHFSGPIRRISHKLHRCGGFLRTRSRYFFLTQIEKSVALAPPPRSAVITAL